MASLIGTEPRDPDGYPPVPAFNTIYDSVDSAHHAILSYAFRCPFGIAKGRATRKKKDPATGTIVYLRHDIICDRGGIPKSSSTGVRNASSRKTGCPWMVKVMREGPTNDRWRIVKDNDRLVHNHPPSQSTAFHPCFRKIARADLWTLERLVNNSRKKPTTKQLQDSLPETCLATDQDIRNHVRKLRIAKLDAEKAAQGQQRQGQQPAPDESLELESPVAGGSNPAREEEVEMQAMLSTPTLRPVPIAVSVAASVVVRQPPPPVAGSPNSHMSLPAPSTPSYTPRPGLVMAARGLPGSEVPAPRRSRASVSGTETLASASALAPVPVPTPPSLGPTGPPPGMSEYDWLRRESERLEERRRVLEELKAVQERQDQLMARMEQLRRESVV